ncbi:MAG: prepilin-type N-terminal cleavage/methylation domain-containing protein [Candidatus Sumerlaeia bacterium]
MFLSHRSTKTPIAAFTLIELLIVVAIIAILAAIAVPNFLEAQVRAKVSRAEADMRSVATALESYMVDNNNYIRSAHNNTGAFKDSYEPPTVPDDEFAAFAGLTTPVSYITTIPPDPFSDASGDMAGKNFYLYYSGTASSNEIEARKDTWVLLTIGPNQSNEVKDLHYDSTGEEQGVVLDLKSSDDEDSWTQGVKYDPTNGTMSNGDVYRFNGGATSSLPDFFEE